jgi:hypothetical protein
MVLPPRNVLPVVGDVIAGTGRVPTAIVKSASDVADTRPVGRTREPHRCRRRFFF